VKNSRLGVWKAICPPVVVLTWIAWNYRGKRLETNVEVRTQISTSGIYFVSKHYFHPRSFVSHSFFVKSWKLCTELSSRKNGENTKESLRFPNLWLRKRRVLGNRRIGFPSPPQKCSPDRNVLFREKWSQFILETLHSRLRISSDLL
jgi:hypothetical protein